MGDYKSGCKYGNNFEKFIFKLSRQAGLVFITDVTLDGAKRRKKGSYDLAFKVGDKIHAIELKTTQNKLLTFLGLWHDKRGSEVHNIKTSQINKLIIELNKGNKAGFIFNFRCIDKMFYVSIAEFMLWALVSGKKSINIKVCEEIGFEIFDMEFIKEF